MQMWRLSDRAWNMAVGYLAAVVFAGIAGFALGATFSKGCPIDTQNAPFGCAEFLLSRYQTLIAAAVAAIALFPVWRQVRLQGTQTDIARSAALRQRITTLSRASEDLDKEIGGLRRQVLEYPDFVDNVSFWAHDTAQDVDRFLQFVSQQRSLRIDGRRAVVARSDLADKMEQLSRALWVINWDVYLDDENAPDEERGGQLQAEAAQAEINLEKTIDAALKSAVAMRLATHDDIAEARTELRALDESLIVRGE